jgi:hypothetical protein
MEWNDKSVKTGADSKRLSAIDDVSKESYVDNARLGCVGASYGGYSAFYLPEYITIVLKRSLLTMAFSIRRACLGQLKKFSSAIGILVRIGKRQCYSKKPIPHSTLLI